MPKTRRNRNRELDNAEYYNESELLYQSERRDNDGSEWLAVMNRMHCTDCNVLVMIPVQRHTGQRLFRQAVAMHEIGCVAE
jgi:hypothetical protein